MAPFVVGSQKEKARGNTTALEQRLGLATSVVIPLLELGAIGFVTWVLVYLVCIQYLIKPSDELQRDFTVRPRRATGIAIITVYAILLLLLLIPWLRLLQTIWSRIDIMPLGDPRVDKEKADSAYFDQYDAYICDYQGIPLFCDNCNHFKLDRMHHCKELGRCVKKMDHFCPWIGGIVAEASHKYFLQFVFFGALYTTYTWLTMAVLLSDRITKTGFRPGTWVAAIAIAVLFCIFTFTMTCMTGYNLCINYTSVEAIQRGGVHNIAFLISRTSPQSSPPTSSNSDPKTTDQDPDKAWPVLGTIQRSEGRVFAVMQSKPLEHPWFTTMMGGWKATMGNHLVDWVLPVKMSPCMQKTRRGEFEWGALVYDMARQYEEDHPGTQLAILH